ncbi:MAG TPA: N-acetyltransferase [Gammaproteobacteria bacterium]|nr:N-acetyltransferase [Gammaproteobacteria bacterium]
MPLQILPVITKQDWQTFLNVPHLLHQHDPNWVPPLQISVKTTLSQKNPFFKRAKMQLWVAYRDNQPVGRIAGIINDAHNEFHNENIAFWGFFEAEHDQHVAEALFKAVEQWAQPQGIRIFRGPVNPSTNYECGLQISAFDTMPYIMMPQNPAYYPQLVEAQGYVKAKDLDAWRIDGGNAAFHPRLMAKAKSFVEQHNITLRPVNLKRFEQEAEHIFATYNDAWEKNWGFVPMEKEEFLFLAKEMKPILTKESCFIVEVAGEVAAFGIWLPDINQVLHKIRDGKLFPTGIFKLLWYTKVKKLMNRGRVPTLGIRKKFRHLNLGSLLYAKFLEVVPPAGYRWNECSWILEDNKSMRTALRLMNAELYKTYRIYEKTLP